MTTYFGTVILELNREKESALKSVKSHIFQKQEAHQILYGEKDNKVHPSK